MEDKLRMTSHIIKQTHRPILLYRNTIEEGENALCETIRLAIGKHIVIIMYAYGGFVPSTFQEVEVHAT